MLGVGRLRFDQEFVPMPHRFTLALAVAAVAGLVLTTPPSVSTADAAGASRNSPFYKPTKQKPLVRGARRRAGGYSYTHEDSIIDFRDRSVFLDSRIDEPSRGPFDSGFFFDSGIERHNDSPYLY